MDRETWEVKEYANERGISPFRIWLSSLDAKTKIRIESRIERVRRGNFGDFKPLGEDIYELRLFFGPGYRIYYAIVGKQVVLLLAGGDKKSQNKDIKAAQQLWDRYKSEL